jgi:hypothetical protein
VGDEYWAVPTIVLTFRVLVICRHQLRVSRGRVRSVADDAAQGRAVWHHVDWHHRELALLGISSGSAGAQEHHRADARSLLSGELFIESRDQLHHARRVSICLWIFVSHQQPIEPKMMTKNLLF